MTTFSKPRLFAGALGALAAFAAAAAIMLRFIPGPHTQLDYIVSGAFGALAALFALFAVLGGVRALRGRR